VKHTERPNQHLQWTRRNRCAVAEGSEGTPVSSKALLPR